MAVGSAPVFRVYAEFDDGMHRGMPDGPGHTDQPFDATTTMVVSWHAPPTGNAITDASLRYRQVHPRTTDWTLVTGDWRPFWHRSERIYRVYFHGLEPDAVYAIELSTATPRVHVHTMPTTLTDRPVIIATAADLQQGGFDGVAGAITDAIASCCPDLFVGGGDFVSANGRLTAAAATQWARYLDGLYGLPSGKFLIEKVIDGTSYPRVVIPHVNVIGNHEIGRENHLRWPSCVATSSHAPGYPTYIPASGSNCFFTGHFGAKAFGANCPQPIPTPTRRPTTGSATADSGN